MRGIILAPTSNGYLQVGNEMEFSELMDYITNYHGNNIATMKHDDETYIVYNYGHEIFRFVSTETETKKAPHPDEVGQGNKTAKQGKKTQKTFEELVTYVKQRPALETLVVSEEVPVRQMAAMLETSATTYWRLLKQLKSPDPVS